MTRSADGMASPEIGELAQAMVKVQQGLSPALKDAENPFVKTGVLHLDP